ncbi:DUF433 domain-containing protein [Cyclobacterium amurskyense]|uniref:PF04255 family protein n=1 Tax=Cyclobacterium amurskyense TaxID=320787 RepID=A0A0H4PDB0_9BACT|nr:DUF433 domain-containing protein [Cyclobacterium amurskyense]AKP52239.1 PF04255 family protein [Cyclobacterium amurskyense]|tara:strand:- start:1220 stop:1468 length:249 start_codon:yes stop_codon:yes gene_type:complete
METQLLDRITVNPEICHGKPTIGNKRYTVDLILDLLSAGSTHAEILEDYPKLEEEDILACLAYASKLLKYSSYTKTSVLNWC